jgi:high-affinity Fe2+/Pb2+ permease
MDMMNNWTKNFIAILIAVVLAIAFLATLLFYFYQIALGRASVPETITTGLAVATIGLINAAVAVVSYKAHQLQSEQRNKQVIEHMDNGFKHAVADAVAEKVKTDVIPNTATHDH